MTTATVARRRIPLHNRRDEVRVGDGRFTLHHRDLQEVPSRTVTMLSSYLHARRRTHAREEIGAQWEPSRRYATVEGTRVGTSRRS